MTASPTLPHIVVIHGALGSATQMQPVAEALRSVGTTSVIELQGHGVTPLGTDDTFGIDTFVGALAAHAARYHPDSAVPEPPLIAFGYSMGGYVALACEARMPGTFAGIVTLGTKFEWTPELAEREASRLDPTRIAEKVPAFAATLEQRHAQAGGWQLNLRNTAALLRTLGEAPLLDRTALQRIRIPVIVAAGSRDGTVTAAEGERTAALMASASSAEIEGAPHPIEQVPVTDLQRLLLDLVASTRQQRAAT